MKRTFTALLGVVLLVVGSDRSHALITGGEGNAAVSDPGWPKGASAIFNHQGRIAWWEGPPFGGGQWHSECKGDAKALNVVLADFAKVEAKIKRVVVHDGLGFSFWLAPNREPEKKAKAAIDWTFTVWQAKSWERLRKLPTDLNPTEAKDESPPIQLDIRVGRLRWADVIIPPGLVVDDRRLEAHGFAQADGVVLEGKVTDLVTKGPIAAVVRLQKVEPQKKGGYLHPLADETKVDARGRWVLKRVPPSWVRVVIEAEGYAPRVAGYEMFDGQPGWKSYDTGLARAGVVSGRVLDESGRPLAEADVTLADVAPTAGGRYESPTEHHYKSDAEGRFRAEVVPHGKARIWSSKPGYVRPGLGLTVTTPVEGVELRMMKSASLRVTVDFGGKPKPSGYIVSMSPEGGDVVGSYGGSGNIDANNVMAFNNVPAGRYVLYGRPNPGSSNEQTESITVDLKGGETTETTIKAK